MLPFKLLPAELKISILKKLKLEEIFNLLEVNGLTRQLIFINGPFPRIIQKIEFRLVHRIVYKSKIQPGTKRMVIQINLIGIYKGYDLYPSFTIKDDSVYGREFELQKLGRTLFKLINKIEACRTLLIDVHFCEECEENEMVINKYFKEMKLFPKLTCPYLLDLNICESRLGKIIYRSLNSFQPVKCKVGTLWAPNDHPGMFLAKEMTEERFPNCELLQWNIPDKINWEKIYKMRMKCLLVPNMKWFEFEDSIQTLIEAEMFKDNNEIMFCLQVMVHDVLILDSFQRITEIFQVGTQKLDPLSNDAESLIESLCQLKKRNSNFFDFPYKAEDFTRSEKQGFYKRNIGHTTECLYFVNQQKGVIHKTQQYVEVFIRSSTRKRVPEP